MSAKSRERKAKFAKLQEAREIEGLVSRMRCYDRLMIPAQTDHERHGELWQRLKASNFPLNGDGQSSIPFGGSQAEWEARTFGAWIIKQKPSEGFLGLHQCSKAWNVPQDKILEWEDYLWSHCELEPDYRVRMEDAEIIIGDPCVEHVTKNRFQGLTWDDMETTPYDPITKTYLADSPLPIWQQVFTNCVPPFAKTFIDFMWTPRHTEYPQGDLMGALIEYSEEDREMSIRSFWLASHYEDDVCRIKFNERFGIETVAMPLFQDHWDIGDVIVVVHALVVLYFLNCRNIVLVESDYNHADRQMFERHVGVPLTKYRTIAVKPTGRRYDNDQPQQHFDVMPLHLVRGHFANYTEDAPRFGINHPRNIGRFWKQPHVRGSEKNGIVVKDYKVQADSR